jgi:fucose 4-O-acetylase-like acetyltransferase
MDALRASSMLLLVPAHVSGLIAVNGDPSAILTGIVWVIHVFRLPLFFAMSGYFLALMHRRRGLRRTLRNRSLRILAPLAIGLITLVPMLMALSEATGVSITAAGPAQSLFGLAPSYLWFLWYLLVIDACAILVLRFAPGIATRIRNLLAEAIGRPLGIALLTVPAAALLLGQSDWMPTAPTDTFRLEPAMLAYYAMFFAFGTALFAAPKKVQALSASTGRWALAALSSGLVALALFTLHNRSGAGTGVHAIQLIAFGIATWTSLHALLGLANRHLSAERPAIRYVADSSYWIYLAHLQILVPLLAVALAIGLQPGVAFVLLTAATLLLTFLFYAAFVRYTAVGRALNGPRTRQPKQRLPSTSTAPILGTSASLTR